MAIKIDNDLLQQVGLGTLPDAEKNNLLRHIYETLEMRVGMRLADQMTNEQLDEFEQYFDAKDDAGAFKWLETNFPNYKEIVQQEFDKLKSEIAASSAQILAAANAAAQQPAPVSPSPVAPAPMPAAPAPAPVAPAPMPASPAPVPTDQPTIPPAPMPLPPQPSVPPMPPQVQPPAPQVPPQPNPYIAPDFPAQQPPAGPGTPPPGF